MSKAETKLKRTLKTLYRQVHEYYRENGIENVDVGKTEMLNYASIYVCDVENKPWSHIILHDIKGGFYDIDAIF